jgi:3',5'-cyclic AMP phosphodiesterase CpdA
VITGDISEAPTLEGHLTQLAEKLKRPIYFVLGNHDYYDGSIKRVREEVARLSAGHPLLHWLPQSGLIALTKDTGLVGHGGWGDALLGNGRTTPVRLNDSRMIEELVGLSHLESLPTLARLGEEAAACLKPHLSEAVARFDRVVVATHVPPYRESGWHMGQNTDDDWAPFFTCKAMGSLLRATFEGAPNCQGTVLCGHCHSGGKAQILPNLEVLTGGAEYGAPSLVQVLTL